MSAMNNERNPMIVVIPVGTQAASITLPGTYLRKKTHIKSVQYIDQAGLAADNTNFLQINLQDGSGNNVAKLDTRAANDGALTANTPKQMALVSPTKGEVELAAGSSLKVVVTKNGTGVPTLGVLCVELYSL